MINKNYKIWIMLFIAINLILLVWSTGYLNFLEEKFIIKDDIVVIKPDNIFKKKIPPEDESFPNEKSKLWKAFEDKEKPENELQTDIVKENALEKNNNKLENNLELGNDFKNKSNKIEDHKSIDLKGSVKSKMEDKNNINKEKIFKSQLVAKEDKIEKNIKNNIVKKDFFYVQVASLSKKDLVEKEWYRFKKKHSEHMKNLIYISQKAELNDNKIFFRILVGKFKNKKQAKVFCDKINFNKCIVKEINE